MDAHLQRIARQGKKIQKTESENARLKLEIAQLKAAQVPDDDELVRRLTAEERPEGWDDLGEEQKIAFLAVKASKLAGATNESQPNEELSSIRRELDDIRYFSNLTEPQMEAVNEVRDKYAGTIEDPEMIHRLAIVEFPDLFGQSEAFSGMAAGRGSSSERGAEVEETTESQIAELSKLDPQDPRRKKLGQLLVRQQIEGARPQ